MPSQVDNNRRSLAYPALIGKGKARINFDNLQYQNPVNYEYFTFDYTNTIGKIIRELPANSVIINTIILNATELFTTSSGIVHLYLDAKEENVVTIGTNASIVITNLVGTGNLITSTYYGPQMQKVFSNKTMLLLYIRASNSTVVTAGKGHGVLQWLNLNLVESYRENR